MTSCTSRSSATSRQAGCSSSRVAREDRGRHWLAYIDADTLPPYPYAQRDERLEELCQALRDAGHSPFSYAACKAV